MTIPIYSRVALQSADYSDEGLDVGAIGYVIEVYPDERYEVEFSNNKGIALAQLVLRGDEIVMCETNMDAKFN